MGILEFDCVLPDGLFVCILVLFQFNFDYRFLEYLYLMFLNRISNFLHLPTEVVLKWFKIK